MKTLLSLLACIAVSASAGNIYVTNLVLGAPPVVPTCSTDTDVELAEHLTGATTGVNTITNWSAQQFTFAGGAEITGFFLKIIDVNDTGSLQAEIWSDDGSNKPSAVISNTTATVPASGLTGGAGANVWIELPQTFTANPGTKYHFVFYAIDGGVYNSKVSIDSSWSIGTETASNNGGSTWNAASSVVDINMSIWGCE